MHQAVIGIVYDPKKNQFLAIKRRDVPIWTFISGGVDPGEQPEAAVLREIEEETGLKVEIKRKIAEFSPVCKLASETHVFECLPISGTPVTTEETADIAFFFKETPPRPFFELHTILLGLALENRNEIVKRPLYEVTYLSFIRYAIQHPIQVLRMTFSKLGLPLNSKDRENSKK